MHSIGCSTAPTIYPLIITLVTLDKLLGVCSSINFIPHFSRNHSIIGSLETPRVMYVDKERCLCRPILPPSGVSIGSIYPHWELCNTRGPTNLTLLSKGRFVFLR